MIGLIGALVVVFGLIIGSFLNVVIYRYQTGYTVLGRSECLICGRALCWRELFPVFSFLVQFGRCRTCLARISWQYPLVELATGLIFLLSWWQAGQSFSITLFYHWLIFCLLIVITAYDWRHKIIPDQFVYAFISLALIGAAFTATPQATILAGLGLFAFFALLWLVSRGRWLGFGDAKLALGLGFFLGWPGGLSAVVFGFWLGALVGIVLILTHGYKLKSELPFAPFLIIGLAAVQLFNFDVFHLFLSSF